MPGTKSRTRRVLHRSFVSLLPPAGFVGKLQPVILLIPVRLPGSHLRPLPVGRPRYAVFIVHPCTGFRQDATPFDDGTQFSAGAYSSRFPSEPDGCRSSWSSCCCSSCHWSSRSERSHQLVAETSRTLISGGCLRRVSFTLPSRRLPRPHQRDAGLPPHASPPGACSLWRRRSSSTRRSCISRP